jgi:hypothetical protein
MENKDLTAGKREDIFNLKNENKTYAVIAKLLKISRTSVYYTLKNFGPTSFLTRAAGSAWPPKTMTTELWSKESEIVIFLHQTSLRRWTRAYRCTPFVSKDPKFGFIGPEERIIQCCWFLPIANVCAYFECSEMGFCWQFCHKDRPHWGDVSP